MKTSPFWHKMAAMSMMSCLFVRNPQLIVASSFVHVVPMKDALLKSESLVVVPPFCIQLKSRQSSLAFMISLDFQMSSLLLFFVYLFSCNKAQNNICHWQSG